jgi:hypothetical protein
MARPSMVRLAEKGSSMGLTVPNILQATVAIASFAAGGFWVKSASVRLPSVATTHWDGGGAFPAALAEQCRWNAYAAWSAAVAALFQILAMMQPLWS